MHSFRLYVPSCYPKKQHHRYCSSPSQNFSLWNDLHAALLLALFLFGCVWDKRRQGPSFLKLVFCPELLLSYCASTNNNDTTSQAYETKTRCFVYEWSLNKSGYTLTHSTPWINTCCIYFQMIIPIISSNGWHPLNTTLPCSYFDTGGVRTQYEKIFRTWITVGEQIGQRSPWKFFRQYWRRNEWASSTESVKTVTAV